MLKSYFRILRKTKVAETNSGTTKVLLKVPPSFSLIGSVILQCWASCEGGGAAGCLEVMVCVVEPLLAPFWQSFSRSHAADLEILSGRNAAAVFV